jgi:predicted amidohydrolase
LHYVVNCATFSFMTTESVLVAAVQMSSRDELEANLATAEKLVRRAVARGASLVGLPENVTFMGPEEAKLATAERFHTGPVGADDGRVARWAASLAAETKTWLLLGGVPEIASSPARVHNTALVVDPQGTIAALYRKVHLFDVSLADGSEYRESKVVEAGGELSVVDTPAGRLGLSFCYDVRFPELYRGLVDRGATILAVPAAFTVPTGRDHWHVLLRARAIESQCYVIAPAQWGSHGHGRVTFGHALVCDPWGTIVAECSDGEGVAIAEISQARLAEVRSQLPSLTHRRLRG